MLLQNIYQLKLWKKKPFQLYTAAFCLMLFLFLFRLLQPCQEYQYNGQYLFANSNSSTQTIIYDQISLSPGVYQIELSFDTDTDLNGFCNVNDGTVFAGALLSNGEHFYANRTHTDYQIWLLESTDQLQLEITYSGNGSLTTGNLHILETRLLWSMLLVITFMIGVVGFAAIIFYYYDRAYSVTVTRKQTIFFLLLITFLSSLPYLSDYTITGADLTYHLQRIEGVKDGLLSGYFPVRLEPEWLYQHGYANGIFYCNSLLYFPALLRILGFPVSASYHLYCIVLNFATVLISYYCFRNILHNRNIGLLCSAFYTLSIVRIYKFVVTSAMGEASAFTFLPLVFYGLYRIFTEDPKQKSYHTSCYPLMLGYAGLMQTHVLSCEVTAVVTLLFCIVYIRKFFCKGTFFAFLKAALGSVALSLWFLVPFLDYYLTQDVHIKHVAARTIQEAGLEPAHLLFHFWRTGLHTSNDGYGVYHSHPVGLGIILIAFLFLFLLLWFGGALRHDSHRPVHFFKNTAVIGCILLLFCLKLFPWNTLQSLHPIAASLISSLQFPNRFLGWATLCTIALLGYLFIYLRERVPNLTLVLTFLSVFCIMTSGLHLQDYVIADQNYYELYNEEGMGFGYISGAEYLIEGTDQTKLTFALPTPAENVKLLSYTPGHLCATLSCINTTTQPAYIDLPLLYYKGYQAQCQDNREFLSLSYGENNVVRIQLPASFDGTIYVAFISPVYWRISEVISALTAILLLTFSLKYRRNRYDRT